MPHVGILKTLNTRIELSSEEPIETLVRHWNLLLQGHEVRSKSKSARRDLARKSVHDLGALGLDVTEAALRKLSNAGLIELELPVTTDTWSWKLPWEFLLTSATSRFRSRSQHLPVVRCLDGKQRSDKSAAVTPASLLVVKSNPGLLSNLYSDSSFRYEQTNVEGSIGLKSKTDAHNLTLVELKKAMSDLSPDVVHFAGIDSIQGVKFNSRFGSPSNDIPEGMMVKAEDDTATVATPDELADALCGCGNHLPTLAAFNFIRSSSFAACTVAKGAHSAIGFYGDVDDLMAESFYANFYLAWRLSEWNLFDAFRMPWSEALEDLAIEKLCGSGVVLWTSSSLLEREKARRAESGISPSVSAPPPNLGQLFEREAISTLKTKPTKAISVQIKELSELNYCLLHNDRDLFRYFYIRKLIPEGVLENVTVEVSLYVGNERLIFRARKDLGYPIWDLVNVVRIPLTASLPRALRESIFTGLHVKVAWSEQPVFENTFRVSLLPIDQWLDDDHDRQWLPSFVLPRDPVVLDVVNIAQKYLAAISDEPTKGFDSYWGTSTVELQVRALWSALVYDFSLSYIVPPPSFKQKGQCLRTPSETVKGRRGTCIDLALLFAAVLEYVEIYPVLFLFSGHAFAGYYSNPEARDEIRTYMLENASSSEDFWMLSKGVHAKVKSLIESGGLVGVETEKLTKKSSFQDARKSASKSVAERLDFEFLVDVSLAREGGVTPLPT